MSKPWGSAVFDYPAEIPTMISSEERRYLFWLAAEHWTGAGHIVEVGPWLGGSTICLALGMRQSGAAGSFRLHVFDNFIWRDFMSERAPLQLQPGESFEAHFRRALKDFEDLVCVHNAWLPDERVEDPALESTRAPVPAGAKLLEWRIGEPVEILFVDGAKSWSAMKYLLRTFADSLLPGRSLLVFQDYKYWGEYWVAIMVEMLSSHLRLVHNLRKNTVAFRVVRRLTTDDVARLPEFEELELSRCEEALEDSALRLEQLGDAKGAAIVRLTRVRMLAHRGDLQAAISAYRRAWTEWPYRVSRRPLERVFMWLGPQTPLSLRPSLKERVRRAARVPAAVLRGSTRSSGAPR